MAYQLRSRMLFCDWHMPGFLDQLELDFDEYFAQVARTGAQSLIFMCKTAHGACLFPSRVGFTHQAMEGDIVGEVVRRSQAMGLEFIAYYNVVLSWELFAVHPEWSQRGVDGQPLRMFLYPCLCMSNDAFRDYIGDHMAEIAANYPVDGFFLDLQYFAPEGCFCDACRDKFRAAYGYDLDPESFGARQWRDFYDYQVATREAFLKSARDRCNAVRPGLSWSWNGCGNPVAISPTLHRGADYLSTEAHPPEYLHTEHVTRFCEGLGLPFTLFMPESQGSWGDWTVTTAATIKGLSAIALAHNGSLNINHIPYPAGDRAGKVPSAVWETITETFAFVREREPYCAGTQPVPVAAALHSADNARLLAALGRLPEHAHRRWEIHGQEHALTSLMTELHVQWEMRTEDLDMEAMRTYELLVVPYLPHVSDELAERLRAYVEGGGALLATWETGMLDAEGERLPNFALSDLFGVDLSEESPYSIAYLDGLDRGVFGAVPDDLPLLLKDPASGRMNPRNRALYCRPHPGAEVLGWLMDPLIESDFEGGRYIYHDHSPPGRRTEYPGIVVNRFGRGRVVYLPSPYFKAYASKHCPYLREVFRALVEDVLGVSQRARVSAPASVHTAFRQDGDGWLLHLVHLQKQTDGMYLDVFHRADPITVRVRPGRPVTSANDCLTGESFAVEEADGWYGFTVPGVTDHSIVRIATE